jgi:type I restriction enzyme S subunit
MTFERFRLDEACLLITDGTHYTPKAQENGRPFLTVKDMFKGSLDFANCSRISEENFQDAMRNGCCPQAGDVLFSKDGTVGKVHPFTSEEECAILSSIAILRPKRETLDQGYFAHFLRSDFFLEKALRNKTGSAIRRIILANLRSLEIPLPPLEEQRRIAAILDKTAELSGANRRRQDLLRAFPLSVYRQMFGDPRHNPFLWPVFQLGEICLNEDARRVPVKSSDRKAMQGRFPYYGASGVIDHVDDYLFEGQRLLVGEDGANLIARSSPIAFIADGKYWVNNHAHVLSENGKAKLRFLEYYFTLVDLKPFVTGSAQPKLTRSALDSLPVPLPPLDLQERFESVLTALDARFAQAEISAQQASSLSCALRYASFQGDAG